MLTVGIDYSMTCPAACAYGAANPFFWFAHATKYTVKLPHVSTYSAARENGMSDTHFYASLAHALCCWLTEHTLTTRVFIEDYAYAATGRVFHIGENAGILKHYLDQAKIAYVVVPPTVIKKFATGKGNADKYKVTAAFLDAYPAARDWIPLLFPRTQDPVPAKSPLTDIADAYWLARYAHEHGA